jgi:hypothetical protein
MHPETDARGMGMNSVVYAAAKVRVGVPVGDNLPRHVCDACGVVHYQNPKIVVGCIPEWEDRILLCRRAIEPRYGLWTLPAGFMENGETVLRGRCPRDPGGGERPRRASRTLYVAVQPAAHQPGLHAVSRRLLDLDFHPGDESLEADDRRAEIPGPQMAFPTVTEALKLYFADRARGTVPGAHARHRARRSRAGALPDSPPELTSTGIRHLPPRPGP